MNLCRSPWLGYSSPKPTTPREFWLIAAGAYVFVSYSQRRYDGETSAVRLDRAVTGIPDAAAAAAGAPPKGRLGGVCHFTRMEEKYVVGETVWMCVCSTTGSA